VQPKSHRGMREIQLGACTLEVTHLFPIDSPCDIILVELQLELVDIPEVAMATIELNVRILVLAMPVTVGGIACGVDAAPARTVAAVLASMKNERATARIGSHHVNVGDGIAARATLREKLCFDGVSAVMNVFLPLNMGRGLLGSARATACCVVRRQCGAPPAGQAFC